MVRRLTSFPTTYKLINEKIAEIRFYYSFSREEEDPEALKLMDEGLLSTDYRYYTFFVTLKDGRGFAFAARTPEFIREAMEKESQISWVESGLLVVSEISVKTLLDALEKCLEDERDYGLEAFGYRSNHTGDFEKWFRFPIGRRLFDFRIAILRRWPVDRRK